MILFLKVLGRRPRLEMIKRAFGAKQVLNRRFQHFGSLRSSFREIELPLPFAES
jgi:hypothetical protein